MAYLVLVRHGLSEYNKLGLWAGWDDPELTPEGHEEAKRTAHQLSDIQFDYGYVSVLKRAKDTFLDIKQTLNQMSLPTVENAAINERNYGIFTGKNKWEVQKEIGDAEFMKLRRSWDYPIPNGESLKQVYERVVPYYEQNIKPQIQEGKNVIIVSSGNALRALVKHLENVSDEDIPSLEIGTGEAYVYEMDADGKVVSKDIRGENINKGKV